MKHKLEKLVNSGLRKTFGISLLLHLLLLLIFYFTVVTATIELPEFVEISFVQAGQPAEKTSPTPRERVEPTSVKPAPPKIEEQVEVEEQIQLPKRRMLESEPPDLRVRSGEKRSPTPPVTKVTPEKSGTEPERDAFVPSVPENRKQGFEPDESLREGTTFAEKESSKKGITASSFEIEGKAAERKILSQVLPSYPEGYGKEGVIKFRFKVLPNGHVAEIIPTMKNDAVLEANAMSAITQWRFNPLPRNVPQEAVEGIITFRYKLK